MHLDFIFFDAGGGHRAAAEALQAVIAQQKRAWNVRLVNLQEILEPLDPLHRVAGIRTQDVYNKMLASGWTLGAETGLKVLHGVVRTWHAPGTILLENFWKPSPPDLVLSLVPNFNRTLRETFERVNPGAPFVTCLTDMADFPPHFWMEPPSEKINQHLICGTERAVQQARTIGYPPERISRTSGMILRPNFYDPMEIDVVQERRKLGLDPDRPTGLVLFGGEGSRAMTEIAERLDRSGIDVQMIFLCGRNVKVMERLHNGKFRIKIAAWGFTREVPRFMRMSDFFIGKPGPGSVTEATAMGLPVIVVSNSWTLPQERYNADWIRETGTGMVLDSFKGIAPAVAEMLAPENFARFRNNVAALKNRAVFEVPKILERIACERVLQ